MQQAPGCSLDAGERIKRFTWLSHTAHPDFNASLLDSQSVAASVRRVATERGMGDRYHLHPHLGGLAVSGRRLGSLLAQSCWLGCQADDSLGTSAGFRDSLWAWTTPKALAYIVPNG